MKKGFIIFTMNANILFKASVLENSSEKSGECSYSLNDYYLEYSLNYKPTKNYLLIYDTLTICFAADTTFFSGFDVFSDINSWTENENIELPAIYKEGKLKATNGFENDNRYSFHFIPWIQYSKKGFVKIEFEKSKGTFFKIAPDLFVEIANNHISSFIIERLTFEE